MIARPEVARMIEEFHDEQNHGGKVNIDHHGQTPSVQTSFATDVFSLVSVIGRCWQSL